MQSNFFLLFNSIRRSLKEKLTKERLLRWWKLKKKIGFIVDKNYLALSYFKKGNEMEKSFQKKREVEPIL